jgi:hypothetical protein
MLLFVFLVFKKAENHFTLLKILFPKELEKSVSYFDLMFGFDSFKLRLDVLFWFYLPFFYNTRKIRLDEREEVVSLRQLLLKNNTKTIISFIAFVLWVYGGGWFLFG